MQKLDENYCLRYINGMRTEAEQAKDSRMKLNESNYRMYHLEHDFSHKTKFQSREVLSKVRNATESTKSFFQQALADLDDWYRVTARDESDGKSMKIRPEEMQKLMNYMLKQANYFSHVGVSAQSGLLGSLSISKVGGEMVSKPKFKTKAEGRGKAYKKHVVVTEDKTWELRFYNVRQEDFYPDPTGAGLYELEECMVDMHKVRALAEGDDAIYDMDAVEQLKTWGSADLDEAKKAAETGQDIVIPLMRPRVKLTEMWGTIVDDISGEVMAENVVITLANDQTIIRKSTPNPNWHQKSPYVAAALIEVASSVWGVAMMDAGTKHNHSLTELFNLMLDSAMKAVWGIGQIRTSFLDDPTQITDGIRWGTNLKVNSTLPPTAKVIEEVITGQIPAETITMFNLLNQETLTSMKTNDLRLGAQSSRAVKATEVVAAENSITSEFQGIAKNFEEKKIQPELEKACWTICQNWDRIDKEVFISIFGDERGEELSQLDPQDVFVETVNGMRFEVFGISLTLRRQADYRKWTTLLQTVGASEMLIEAFLQRYSFEKLLGEIMTSIDLNKAKIEHDKPQSGDTEGLSQPGGAPAATPNQLSQVPLASGQPNQDSLAAAFGGIGNQMNMPSSQAIR